MELHNHLDTPTKAPNTLDNSTENTTRNLDPSTTTPDDIGIPNGPARNSTRGLLKAHYSKNKKIWKPKDIIKES
jgi:hypothetical protein